MAVTHYTYDGNPGASPLQAARFYSGDTDRDAAQLDDNELLYALEQQPNPILAAALALEGLATKLARTPDVTAGKVSRSNNQAYKAIKERIADLRKRAGVLSLPFFGGLTNTGKEDLASRTEDVQPRFSRGLADNPRALQLDDTQPAILKPKGAL